MRAAAARAQKDPGLVLDLKILNALVDEYRCYFGRAAVLLSMGIYARQHQLLQLLRAPKRHFIAAKIY